MYRQCLQFGTTERTVDMKMQSENAWATKRADSFSLESADKKKSAEASRGKEQGKMKV